MELRELTLFIRILPVFSVEQKGKDIGHLQMNIGKVRPDGHDGYIRKGVVPSRAGHATCDDGKARLSLTVDLYSS